MIFSIFSFLVTQKVVIFFLHKSLVFWHFFKSSPLSTPFMFYKLSPSLKAYFYPPPHMGEHQYGRVGVKKSAVRGGVTFQTLGYGSD